MTVGDVYQWLDQIAPFNTQESFDNSGLLLGDPAAAVTRILFTLDVTPAVAAEAVRLKAQLIVSHHPLLFQPVRQIRYDQSEGAIIRALAEAGVSLIAAHTNLDQCAGGVADTLTQTLALEAVTPCAEDLYLRTGTLAAPCTAKEFLVFLNRRLHTSACLHGDPERVLRTLAAAPGAGGDSVPHARADALVTGELKHHEILVAVSRGLTVFAAGHYPTEFPGIAALHQRFSDAASQNRWNVEATLFSLPPYPCITHA